jgi:chromosomal replication initiation ATPase DnaA
MIWTEQAIKEALEGTVRGWDQYGNFVTKTDAKAIRPPVIQPPIVESILSLDDVETQNIRLHDIILASCRVCGVELNEFKSPRRTDRVVRARHIYMFVAGILTEKSWVQIGRACNRDHSSVMYGYDKVANNRAAYEPELSRVIRVFRNVTRIAA